MPGTVKKTNPPNKLPTTNEKNFNLSVQNAEERISFFNSEFPKLGQDFFTFMQNKTLLKNKGPVEKDIESQLLRKISMLAEQMNIDETQKESAGSMALSTLFMIVFRDLRDRINLLEFDLVNLQNKISAMEASNVKSVDGKK